MSPKPDPFFKVSPLPLMPASPPWKQPPKSCPLGQLADEYDSGTSNRTARIWFPRTQSPSSPQERRERSVQKSPEDPAACGASDFLWTRTRGLPGQLQCRGGDPLLILERTEPCAGKDWVVFCIWNTADQPHLGVQVGDGLSGFSLCRFEQEKCRRRAWVYSVCVCACVCVCVSVGLVARLCLTLCDPMDCSPPGSSIHGISQARLLGVGCHLLLQGDLPDPGIKPMSPAWKADSLPLSYDGSLSILGYPLNSRLWGAQLSFRFHREFCITAYGPSFNPCPLPTVTQSEPGWGDYWWTATGSPSPPATGTDAAALWGCWFVEDKSPESCGAATAS